MNNTNNNHKKKASIGGNLKIEPGKIELHKVILVDGQDEVYFFDALLRFLKIFDVEVREAGGGRQFIDNFSAFCTLRGFEDVKSLGVTRDAEDNADGAFENIKHALRQNHMKVPGETNQFTEGKPRIGIFIMPGDSDKGMLENLCLKTVKEHPAMNCVNAFISCASSLEDPLTNIPKASAQAFLAAMPKIVNSVGLGAQRNYWSFASNELTSLKSFLKQL